MTPREERIAQKFLALEMWIKRAMDKALLGNSKESLEALSFAKECLFECAKTVYDEQG